MIDTFNAIKGHLTVETVDINGIVLDKFEDNNMIMNTARTNMARLVSGESTGNVIDKFVIGTEGHNLDYLVPKNSSTGFVPTLTGLFSETLTDKYHYEIRFDSTGESTSNAIVTYEDNNTEHSTVTITNSGYDVTYLVVIPAGNANGTGTAVFTEAALYAGSNIFSMKTFAAKIKDGTVSLRITWKLSF